MNEYNVIERSIIPETPRVVDKEKIMVYMPEATVNTKGIAAYDLSSFIVADGIVSLRHNLGTRYVISLDIDKVSGIAELVYSDGTKTTVAFPNYDKAHVLQLDLLTEVTIVKSSFVQTKDNTYVLSLPSDITGYNTDKFIAAIEIKNNDNKYVSEYAQLVKSANGDLAIIALQPFDGRLLLVGKGITIDSSAYYLRSDNIIISNESLNGNDPSNCVSKLLAGSVVLSTLSDSTTITGGTITTNIVNTEDMNASLASLGMLLANNIIAGGAINIGSTTEALSTVNVTNELLQVATSKNIMTMSAGHFRNTDVYNHHTDIVFEDSQTSDHQTILFRRQSGTVAYLSDIEDVVVRYLTSEGVSKTIDTLKDVVDWVNAYDISDLTDALAKLNKDITDTNSRLSNHDTSIASLYTDILNVSSRVSVNTSNVASNKSSIDSLLTKTSTIESNVSVLDKYAKDSVQNLDASLQSAVSALSEQISDTRSELLDNTTTVVNDAISAALTDVTSQNKQVAKNSMNIKALYSVLQHEQLILVAEDVYNNLSISQSGYDLYMGDVLDIVDSSYTTLTKIEGQSKVSKNLLNIDAMTNSALVKNNDGSYTMKYNNANDRYSAQSLISIPVGSYVLSGEILSINSPDGATKALSLETLDKDGNRVGEVNYLSASTGFMYSKRTIDADVRYIRLYINPGVADGYSITFKNLMINTGETAKPFEPYYEGVRSATISGIKSTGKNLFPTWEEINPFFEPNKNKYSGTTNGITFTMTEKGITAQGTAVETKSIEVVRCGGDRIMANFPKGTYTLKKTGDKNKLVQISFFNGTKEVLYKGTGQNDNYAKQDVVCVVTEDCDRLWIAIILKCTAGEYVDFTFEPMLQIGSTVGDYEYPKESIMTLPEPLALSEFDVWEDNKVKNYKNKFILSSSDIEFVGSRENEDFTAFEVFESTNFVMPDDVDTYPNADGVSQTVNAIIAKTLSDGKEYVVDFSLVVDDSIIYAYCTPAMTNDLWNEFYVSIEQEMQYRSTQIQHATDFIFDNKYPVYKNGTTQVQGATERINVTLINEYLIHAGEEGGDK